MSVPTQEEWAEAAHKALTVVIDSPCLSDHQCSLPRHHYECLNFKVIGLLYSLLTRAEQGGV